MQRFVLSKYTQILVSTAEGRGLVCRHRTDRVFASTEAIFYEDVQKPPHTP
jgi:hypothetical protein